MMTALYVSAATYLVGGIVCFVDFITKVRYPVHLGFVNEGLWLTIKRTEKPVFGFIRALCMACIWPYGAFYLRRKYAGYAWFGPYPIGGGGWRRLTSRDLRRRRRSLDV